jgi:diguanylate cyclase (GGDEF)-like protein
VQTSFNILFPDAFKSDLPQPRILLVDDQMINILTLREIFKADCEVFMATNGQQALEQASKLLPDIILLDVVMEGMDGYAVCEKLKSNPLTSGIPVIFVTSHFDQADEVRGFELGGADFIHKPVNAVITKVRVANQIALKRQTDLLHSIALIDGLTGIANRRQFNQAMQLHWQQANRDKTPLSLIMIDVDFFKRYNDHYGHPEGDACLRKLAHAIRSSLQRPYDLVARYGGEEFACILPKTDANGATFIASQIQDKVRDLAIPHAKSEVSNIVTVSMGVVCTVPGGVIKEDAELIIATDKQLYKAKSDGRNRMSVELLD